MVPQAGQGGLIVSSSGHLSGSYGVYLPKHVLDGSTQTFFVPKTGVDFLYIEFGELK